MHFLIAGDSGYLGTALRSHLEGLGHQVTGLTRGEPRADQLRWAPDTAPLGIEVVENADVVVCLTGSPLLGVPRSSKYQKALWESRIQPTRTLAEAIAASDRKPAFLAANGTSFYGDSGDEVLTEGSPSRGDALLTRVTRAWQQATEPAAQHGARVCVLRNAPVFGGGGMAAPMIGRVFKLGIGGRLGSGRQYFPMIALHDWVEAVTFLATEDSVSGPVNMSVPEPVRNAELTRLIAEAVHRPAAIPVPAAAIKAAAGPMAPELLSSLRVRPQKLLDAGFAFDHPTAKSVVQATYGG